MSRNVVFLVGSYYPNYSAVGRCQGNIADELEKQGYNVTIIAEKTRINEVSTEKLGNQKIVRITNLHISARLHTSEKKGMCEELAHQTWRIVNASCKIANISSLRQYEVDSYYRALKLLDFVPDLIVPTCLPFETVVAATKYKKEVGGCRVVPVLYDMFAENSGLTLTTWNKNIKRKRNLLIEKDAFLFCDKILHMPSWTPYFNEKHPEFIDKTVEVEHPLIKEPIISDEMVFGEGINMVFTGAVDNKIRNPEPILDIFSKGAFPNVKLHFYALGNAVDKIKNASRQSDTIIYHGKVDSAHAHKVIAAANVLVSIGNSEGNQFPSKIFEYMSTGKPIIHFYQIDKDPVCPVLNEYPLSLCVPTSSIQNQIETINLFIEDNQNQRLDFDEVLKLFVNASPKTISSMLSEIADGE